MKHRKLSILDNETGEIVGDYKPRIPRRPGHKYLLVYYKNLVESKTNFTLLELAILGEMNGLNQINLTTRAKKYLITELEVKLQSIDNAIFRLIDKGLVIRINNGNYFVNPYYFTKSNKNKTLELIDEYNQLRNQAKNSRKPRKPRAAKKPAESNLRIVNLIDDNAPL